MENKKKKPERVERGPDGHLYIVRGKRRILKWTPQMEADMRRFYPDTPNKELAEIMGINRSAIVDKARQMGIRKDSEWLKQMRRENVTMLKPLPKNHSHLYTAEHRAKMVEGLRRYIKRSREQGTYVSSRACKVYCVDDKTTYNSIKQFTEAKQLPFHTNVYTSLKRTGRIKGYTLVKL